MCVFVCLGGGGGVGRNSRTAAHPHTSLCNQRAKHARPSIPVLRNGIPVITWFGLMGFGVLWGTETRRGLGVAVAYFSYARAVMANGCLSTNSY